MRCAAKVPSMAGLTAVPALMSTAVTTLRLVGELMHWPKPLVNSDVCGKAILGVVWLVPIFGSYFAVEVSHAGYARQRFARPPGFGDFGIRPQARRNVRDAVARDDIRAATLAELRRYPDRTGPGRHGDGRRSPKRCWSMDTYLEFRWPSCSTFLCVAVGARITMP